MNAAPHAVRFLMGALVVQRVPPITHLAAVLLLGVAFSCLRRQVERDRDGWHARPTLEAYGRRELAAIAGLSLTGLAALALWQAGSAPGFYGGVLATAVMIVGGAHASASMRLLAAVWMR